MGGKRTYEFEGDERPVGDDGGADEVVALGIGLQQDTRLGHHRAGEIAQRGHLERLPEFHGVLAIDAGHAQLRFALDREADGLVEDEVVAEDGKGLHVEYLGDLRDVDGRVGRGRDGRELDLREGPLRRPVLEEEHALEGVDDGVDRVVGLDGAVDGDVEAVGLGLGEVDALDLEGGGVDAGLGDLWDGDEYSGGWVSGYCSKLDWMSVGAFRHVSQAFFAPRALLPPA